MKFDIQVPLTAPQFDRLKVSENLKADLASVLPKAKFERIKTYLGDPSYLLSVVRPFRGKAAYLLLRMARPIQTFWVPAKLHRLMKKIADRERITINQFVKGAIQYQLDKLVGKQ
jgi:hypothetical protein